MTRRWPYVALALLVVGLGGLAAWRLTRDDPGAASDPRVSLPLPDRFGPWRRLFDPPTERAEDSLADAVAEGGAAVDVGLSLYARADGTRARVTVLLPRPGSTSARDLARDPAAQLDGFVRGSATDPERQDAPSGVTLLCGTSAATFSSVCGWADARSLVLVAYHPGLDRAAAAALTRDLLADLAS